MTCRHCTMQEQGACEQFGLDRYEVRKIPTGPDKRLPLTHPAARESGETGSIRISTCSARPVTIYRVDECFAREILRYRTEMAWCRDLLIRHEIRFQRVHNGYRWFATQPDRIQEIPPTGKLPARLFVEEVL